MLSFSLAAGWAQTGERPLRLVPSALPGRFTTAAGAPLPEFAPNTLLSEEALERPLTRRYIGQYSSPGGIAWLEAVLRRGSLYLPFIREEIAKRNLPPELACLPVIESGFLSSARSKSGAVGLWQFMMNSIGPFDMKVNDLVDERRDFRKSTLGALRKLEDNFKALGSWPLALAAYNAGLGGVNRAAQRGKSRDYWELSANNELKSETVHYVPKLLATACIIAQPRRFGLDWWPETVDWTDIPLSRQVSLDILAAEAGLNAELLRRLNDELLHGLSPPDKNYRLKIPAAAFPLVSEALAREDLKLLNFYRYTVKYGDTLSALARHYGIPLDLIAQYNPGILGRYLQIGEKLTIPAFQEIRPYTGAAATAETLNFDGTHLVKRGETLWSLALACDVDPQALAEANGMELNQILPEGKRLKVPIR